MDRSLFLARLLGPTFVAIALGILINRDVYKGMIAEAYPSVSASSFPAEQLERLKAR